MISIESIIKDNEDFKDNCYCVCQWKDDLVVVPCENTGGGFYPDYDKSIILKENCQLQYKNKNYYNDGVLIEKDNICGIMYCNYNFGGEVSLVVDSWDGFQPIGDCSIDSFLEFMNEMCNALKPIKS